MWPPGNYTIPNGLAIVLGIILFAIMIWSLCF